MTKIRGVTGGGYDGNKVSHYSDPKREPTVYKVDPGRTSTIGQSVYFHKGPLQTQGGYSNPVGPSDSMGQGPGANRVVMRAGSQSATPNPTPMGTGRSLFEGPKGRR
jgi:hypothetical protein